MASNITQTTDYIGIVDLSLGQLDTYFDNFAFEIEKQILRGDGFEDFGLLGDDVYIAMIADLDGNNEPQTAPYINLIDGINYVGNDGRKKVFGGIRKMLTYFVYSDYIKSNRLSNAQLGTILNLNENAENVDKKDINHAAHLRWNKGVDLYNIETYDYILFNQSDFTNWEFTRQGRFLTKGII